MYEILTLNKISKFGLDKLDAAKYAWADDYAAPDAIMVRSAAMHEMKLDKKTVAVARCGAGTNNIPVEDYAGEGVVVFNTPGANANGVKELVLCALLLSSRKIVPGIEWCKTLKGQGDAACGGELGGVYQQVDEQLLQAGLVGVERQLAERGFEGHLGRGLFDAFYAVHHLAAE